MLNPDFKDMLSVFGEEGVNNITVEDFTAPDLVFQTGVEPRRVDLLTTIDGVEFDAAWKNRITAEVDGLEVPVLGLADLIRNKEAVGRPRDLADVDELKRLRSG